MRTDIDSPGDLAETTLAEILATFPSDEALGERVKAVIETTRAGVLSEADIKLFLEDKLARYKIPEKIEFMDQIPRN